MVRGLGLIGGGQDPMQQVLAMNDPREAAATTCAPRSARRIREIRQIVVAATTTSRSASSDVVEGGPVRPGEEVGERGVVVGHQTRLGRVSLSRPRDDADGRRDRATPTGNRVWDDEDDVVQGIVLLRKGEESLPALEDVKAKIEELNEHARAGCCPGVQDRAVLRPHRPDRRHHRDGPREPAASAWCW